MRRGFTAVLLAIAASLGAAATARAAPGFYYVQGTAESPLATCQQIAGAPGHRRCDSLRAAVDAANAKPEQDTIYLLADGEYTVTQELALTDGVTISGRGPRQTALRGSGASRVFQVAAGVTATLHRLGIAGGRAPTEGGNVLNHGTLLISDVRISDGRALSGGGIANIGPGQLALTGVLVDNNAAASAGGGVWSRAGDGGIPATLTIVNSTIAFNRAAEGESGQGGGLATFGSTQNQTSLSAVTVARNTATGTAGIWVGLEGEQVDMRGSIVASNLTLAGGSFNCGGAGTIVDVSASNVEDNDACGFERSGGQAGLSPTLLDRGGYTDVLTITPESIAKDAVQQCLNGEDQRHAPRAAAAVCDAGAFEEGAVAPPLDTAPPTVTIDSGPTDPTREIHVAFGFSANEPDVRFECTHVFPPDPGGSEVFDDCKPGVILLRDLVDGRHGFSVVAVDRAGNRSAPDGLEFVVDATPPPVATVSADVAATSARFSFEPTEPGARFECRLQGPGQGTGFEACTSPRSYTGLAPGRYRFSLRTLDALGNASDSPGHEFTIAAPPTPTPTATATAAATPAPSPAAPPPAAPPTTSIATVRPAPRPELGRAVVVRPLSGRVLVRRPGATEFVALTRSEAVPLGSTLDTKGGRVKLTAAAQQAELYGGIFLASQRGAAVDLRLTEKLGSCRTRAAPRARRLWGAAKGRFQISGRYAVAIARGGMWLVQDSCAGTLTRVTQGVVAVRSRSGGRTLLVRKGRRHLARARR